MSKRFGKARVPGCICTSSFTCGPCLEEAGHRAQAARFGVFATHTSPAPHQETPMTTTLAEQIIRQSFAIHPDWDAATHLSYLEHDAFLDEAEVTALTRADEDHHAAVERILRGLRPAMPTLDEAEQLAASHARMKAEEQAATDAKIAAFKAGGYRSAHHRANAERARRNAR